MGGIVDLSARHSAGVRVAPTSKLLALLAVASFLPIVVNDPRVTRHEVLLALGSIVPFCGLLGYLTPSLIDRYSHDDPRLAGKAYAINVIGCVLGPLVAGYVLLPALGARFGMLLLVAPFPILFVMLRRSSVIERSMACRNRDCVGGSGPVFAFCECQLRRGTARSAGRDSPRSLGNRRVVWRRECRSNCWSMASASRR